MKLFEAHLDVDGKHFERYEEPQRPSDQVMLETHCIKRGDNGLTRRGKDTSEVHRIWHGYMDDTTETIVMLRIDDLPGARGDSDGQSANAVIWSKSQRDEHVSAI